MDVFSAGEGGYYCIKIPVLLSTQNSTLIALGEARRPDCSVYALEIMTVFSLTTGVCLQDYTWTDLVIKRSTDGGATWSNLTVLYSNSSTTDFNVVGNAAIVQDRDTGELCRHQLSE